MIVFQRFERRIAATLLLAAMAVLSPATALAQPTLDDANRLIAGGRDHLRRGSDLEQAGDLNAAMQAYAMAADNASEALRIGDVWSVPPEEKPAGLYFLYGQSALSLAQLRIELRQPPEKIDRDLFEAEQAFRDTIRFVDFQHPRESPEWAGRKAEAIFAIGTVFFIRGDLKSARIAMLDVLDLAPGHPEARGVLDAIEYAAGRSRNRRTDTGRMLPERPSAGVSDNRLKQYAIEIGKALFGRWGTIAGMLMEDAFPSQ